MAETKKIKTALVSVFHKDGLDELLKELNNQGVKFLSTGGTQSFIESLGYECQAVEDLTTYPSILGGRVKTLHPKVFGGILGRRENEGDKEQMAKYVIPEIDLVIVDLYPFEQTVASGASQADIIDRRKEYHKILETLSVFLGNIGARDKKLGSRFYYPVKRTVLRIFLEYADHSSLVYGPVAKRSGYIHPASYGTLDVRTLDIILDQSALNLKCQAIGQYFCTFIKCHAIEFLNLAVHSATISGESNQYS